MRILGIDPGIGGAIAVLDAGWLSTMDMPTVEIVRNNKRKREIDAVQLARWLGNFTPDGVAILERVNAMPGQGVSSMFAFGRSVGMVEGILAALLIPVHYVVPQVWQKGMGVAKGDGAARLRASQLRPQDAGQWARVKDHGRADAALIAMWGERMLSAAAKAREAA